MTIVDTIYRDLQEASGAFARAADNAADESLGIGQSMRDRMNEEQAKAVAQVDEAAIGGAAEGDDETDDEAAAASDPAEAMGAFRECFEL